jgi:predicted transposase/invertase (TIGR01784 family)
MQAELNRTKGDTLPLIYPIVFYTGKEPYQHSNDIYDLFEDKELAKQLVFQPFQLIDLTQIDDEELQQHQRASLMELAAKHIFDRDIMPFVQSIQCVLKELDKEGYSDDICLVVEYIIQAGKAKDNHQIIDSIAESLSPEARGKVMTIADQLKREGKQEGLQQGFIEGKLEVAKKLLNKGSDVNTITELTDLPRNKIEELKKQIQC